jgi:hypothetical protein
MVDLLLDDALAMTVADSSDIDATSWLHNELEKRAVKSAFVAVNQGSNDPFFTCLAVETSDQGIMHICLVPKSVGVKNQTSRTEYVQAVFVRNGDKIGFLEAQYAGSHEYSWYTDYLKRAYDALDFGEYLGKYREIVEKNEQKLLGIKEQNSKLKAYMESNIYYCTDYQVDRFNDRLVRFDIYVDEYNAQSDDYNRELEKYRKMSDVYPSSIYYVTETRKYPYAPIALPAPFKSPTVYPYPVPASPRSSYSYSVKSEVDRMLGVDDSYSQLPAPDRSSVTQFERVSDKNFVVTSFQYWW